MVIAPRFRRVAALQRPFVNRQALLDAFAHEKARVGADVRVLNVTGVGGIGKSRLLRQLADSLDSGWRSATIDLQIPALRQQDDALAVLRGQFGGQGVRFDRFDIAYAVLWQRLHPHLRLTKSDLPFVETSSILTEIVDSVSGVPVFGTALGLLKLLDKASSGVREKRKIKQDSTLEALDSLPNNELSDAVTYLFAEDLRASTTDKPYAVFVDTYEALVPSPARTGRVHLGDAWLRDLIGQLTHGLVVVASREPLRWETHDPEWATVTRVCDLGGLPMPARLELLTNGGVTEPRDQDAIARASAGLPFYLNLAVDTYQQTGRRDSGLVSQEEILNRFLAHVSPDEITTLEILSPARLFDYEVFRAMASEFNLPGYRVAWDSLTAYSFIYPAGSGVRFHQLMREALLRRLEPPACREIHRLLHHLWDNRAAAAAPSPQSVESQARALREAAFHGVQAETIAGPELLGYADRAMGIGAHPTAAGIADDVETVLLHEEDAARRQRLDLVLRTLRAEAAVRLGEASAALSLTALPVGSAATVGREVEGRFALARGHGQRIMGETEAALDSYQRLWREGTGTTRLAAGLWAADLHMCQGRFVEAETLAAEIDAQAPADAHELRGDVARLRHLAGRFSFRFDLAERFLGEAETHYTAANSVVGLANIATNRTELLAITAPDRAVAAAGLALDAQREIGARHELGKIYTAVAIAHIQQRQFDAAASALQSAFSELDRAGYRSGRARAEVYQALLFAHVDRFDEAQTTLAHAVAELEGARVYPTLILCAARAGEVLGLHQPGIFAAAGRARASLELSDSPADLDGRIDAYVHGFLAGIRSPTDLFQEAAAHTDRAAGFYNHNVRVTGSQEPVILRIPIPGSDEMDLKIWPEAAVLRALRGRVHHAPRLLHAQESPSYQIHSFVSGDLLDEVAPRGVAVPEHVVDDVLALLAEIGRIPRESVPTTPADWPVDGDTAAFGRRLSALTDGVHRRFSPVFDSLFTDLGFPDQPLAAVEAGWSRLRARPFRLLHTDIHRKNMILSGGETYFLDWELALWGDPLYDLAVHMHKMAYQPAEEERLVAGWPAAVGGEAAENWREDLDVYRTHERIKSAVVDTVRYTKLLAAPGLPDARRTELLGKLVAKLNAAYGAWGLRRTARQPDIAAAVQRWIDSRPGA